MGIAAEVGIGVLHQYMLVLCPLGVAVAWSPHGPACEMGS